MKEKISLILQTLPHKPGVYQHLDKNGTVIYVGKAKDLKKRVSSYFQKEHDSARTRLLVRKIEDIKTIVVETEFDALLLENNLIKKYQPKYNVMLKDDKSYPWICVKKERFPRIIYTRNMVKDGSEYFGPYANPRIAKILLQLFKEIYNIRTCNYDLSEHKINEGKYKVCLEYHLGNCLGPCEGLQTEEEYMKMIDNARNILKGNFKEAKAYLVEQMNEFAQKLEFEKAQNIKEKLEVLEKYQARSTVIHPSITNVDVYSITSDESYAYINFFNIVNGSIIRSHTTEIKKKLEETDEEILAQAIIELRERFPSNAREIYLPFALDFEIPGVKITVPLIGDKRKIVELSEKNAKYYKIEKLKQTKIVDPDRHTNRIMAQMKADLHLPVEPRHIEGFDNSNIQGTNPVSACVVFKNGKPSKKDYRIFNVKTVEGPDDFASMEEVIYRRYKRMLEEGEPLPQLILIDGGKGQLGAALKSLDKLGLRGKISIIGIAKRLEEIFFPGDSTPLYLDKTSETLKVLQHVRNESHRFGITRHRNRRSKNAFNSELENIKGIGEQSIKDLLKHFKSVERIKHAEQKELEEVLGVHKAGLVYKYFHP
ncbi:excinuclease ABC subunit UvrC [Ornithobacterium rhinotracheale]|uniref:excinuclease ABC subunit UvrC n=1 Tax=Ornithobacterium rhinotracheale TaxID=28251 RepID=UPI00129C6C82|nr:excinuclease ABC subunit UvrC [Ornithobacterium rhinotracheale]MRI63815.1 excinuclease ABC subunit UvrC [Ornithobacterium rhinotracheale]